MCLIRSWRTAGYANTTSIEVALHSEMNAPRAVQGMFLVVPILSVASSIKHTSVPSFQASGSHNKTSSGPSLSSSAWGFRRFRPQFFGGFTQKLERAEAIWRKTVERRHKMLMDYKDPKNKDLSV